MFGEHRFEALLQPAQGPSRFPSACYLPKFRSAFFFFFFLVFLMFCYLQQPLDVYNWFQKDLNLLQVHGNREF